MPVTRIDNPKRWTAWARSFFRDRSRRRRMPLPFTLVRRLRGRDAIAHHHHHTAYTLRVENSMTVENSLLAVTAPPVSVAVSARVSVTEWRPAALTYVTQWHQMSRRGEVSPSGSFDSPAHDGAAAETGGPGAVAMIVRHTIHEVRDRLRRVEERVLVPTRLAARNATRDTASQATPPAVDPRGPDWWKTSAPGTFVQHRPSAPSINIDQVTENVLRQLDRRVDSWRERKGRI